MELLLVALLLPGFIYSSMSLVVNKNDNTKPFSIDEQKMSSILDLAETTGAGGEEEEEETETSFNVIEDDLTCYCNLPECVVDNYLCKTTYSQGSGACFTDVAVSLPIHRAVHGCLHLLDRNAKCRNDPISDNSIKKRKLNKKKKGMIKTKEEEEEDSSSSLLLCCFEDLCNHVDIPQNELKYNDSVMAAILAGTKQIGFDLDLKPMTTPKKTYLHNMNESWITVATIIIPAIGGLILLVLFFVACKILRTDIDKEKLNESYKLKPEVKIAVPFGGQLQSYYNKASPYVDYRRIACLEEGLASCNYGQQTSININRYAQDDKLKMTKVPLLLNQYCYNDITQDQVKDIPLIYQLFYKQNTHLPNKQNNLLETAESINKTVSQTADSTDNSVSSEDLLNIKAVQRTADFINGNVLQTADVCTINDTKAADLMNSNVLAADYKPDLETNNYDFSFDLKCKDKFKIFNNDLNS